MALIDLSTPEHSRTNAILNKVHNLIPISTSSPPRLCSTLPDDIFTSPNIGVTQPMFVEPIQKIEPDIDESVNKKLLVEHIPAFGILCALINVLCFSFNSVIVKLLKFHYSIPAIEVLVVRSMFQFTICGLTVICKGYSIWGEKGSRLILGCRAITGTLSLCCIFSAFNLVPIGDVTTIYFSSPVIVTIIAFFYLNEPFRCIQMVTCFLTILGITFIVQPEMIFGRKEGVNYPHMTMGLMLAIMALITSSITMVNLRKLKTTPAAVVVFWFSISILIFGSYAIYLLDMYKPINIYDPLCSGLLVTIGLMSVCEQYFLTVALQFEDATTISVTRSFNIVLAFLWEVVIFNEVITWPSIVGGILVTGCILLLALTKSYQNMFQSFVCVCGGKPLDVEQPELKISPNGKQPYPSSD